MLASLPPAMLGAAPAAMPPPPADNPFHALRFLPPGGGAAAGAPFPPLQPRQHEQGSQRMSLQSQAGEGQGQLPSPRSADNGDAGAAPVGGSWVRGTGSAQQAQREGLEGSSDAGRRADCASQGNGADGRIPDGRSPQQQHGTQMLHPAGSLQRPADAQVALSEVHCLPYSSILKVLGPAHRKPSC